jgi:hypothetical protein
MERMAGWMRQSRMTDQRPLRDGHGIPGLLGAAVLVAALAGCASATSAPGSSPAAAATSASAGAAVAGAAGAGAAEAGCAGVTQATAVTIRQTTQITKPVISRPMGTTYRQPGRVQALFGQLCAAVTHPVATTLMHCPADIGTSYLGTFYGGSRTLGTFTYAVTGCQRVSLTAAGTTLSTMVYGRAAAAAPHLSADLAALVGTPEPGVTQSQGGVNPGGPDDSAQP